MSIFEEFHKGYSDLDHRLRKIFGSRHMQDATPAQTLRRLSVQDPRAHGCINAGEAFAVFFWRLRFAVAGQEVTRGCGRTAGEFEEGNVGKFMTIMSESLGVQDLDEWQNERQNEFLIGLSMRNGCRELGVKVDPHKLRATKGFYQFQLQHGS